MSVIAISLDRGHAAMEAKAHGDTRRRHNGLARTMESGGVNAVCSKVDRRHAVAIFFELELAIMMEIMGGWLGIGRMEVTGQSDRMPASDHCSRVRSTPAAPAAPAAPAGPSRDRPGATRRTRVPTPNIARSWRPYCLRASGWG
ncbi:MAG: hypothetical protein AAFX79_07185 [Planctomycetota bacterium]